VNQIVILVESNVERHQTSAGSGLTNLAYRLVPFQLPEQPPPANVPVIARRSADNVAVNV
jgi:hypothetical protein